MVSSSGLTPNDVHNMAFSKPPIGTRGYDEDEVDAFLDRAEKDLEAGLPLVELVRAARFSKPPLGKRGYNEAEVEAFLDRLAGDDPRTATGPASTGPASAGSTSAGSIGDEALFAKSRGFLARLLGRR